MISLPELLKEHGLSTIKPVTLPMFAQEDNHRISVIVNDILKWTKVDTKDLLPTCDIEQIKNHLHWVMLLERDKQFSLESKVFLLAIVRHITFVDNAFQSNILPVSSGTMFNLKPDSLANRWVKNELIKYSIALVRAICEEFEVHLDDSQATTTAIHDCICKHTMGSFSLEDKTCLLGTALILTKYDRQFSHFVLSDDFQTPRILNASASISKSAQPPKYQGRETESKKKRFSASNWRKAFVELVVSLISGGSRS